MEWSEYQRAIFDDVATGDGNTVVVARAGTGKTTTIVEALKHVPAGETCLLVAFNKSIARELGERTPPGVRVATLHSHGFSAVRREFPGVAVEEGKARRLVMEQFPKVHGKMRTAACKVASLAKGAMLPDGDSGHVGQMLDVMDQFWVADFPTDAEREQVAQMALWLLDRSRDVAGTGGTIDFDDMIWLPAVLHLSLYRNDRVFVDEAQDLNPCQHVLVQSSVKRHGRLCAVGDDRQAIYGFRGADRDSLNRIATVFAAKRLPLSITYRCPKLVVQAVQPIVPDYQAADSNPDGVVEDCGEERMMMESRAGDFILSRTNAPLIGHCLDFIKAGKRATILGRNIGKSLGSLVEQSKAEDVPALVRYVEAWADREAQRMLKRDVEAPVGHIYDRRDCLKALAEAVDTVEGVRRRIDELFGDGDPLDCIALSSTHRAKGLERDRVWMLRDTYLRGKSQEERNLFYVAATRAKRELRFVRSQ